MSDEAQRARRYLLQGDPALALGTCEAALAAASGESALALRMTAARAAQELADLPARLSHLEAAEALCRAAGLDALGSVLLELGDLQLRRGRPGEAGLALDEALGALGADEPLRARALRLREEARAREAEAEAEPTPAHPLAAPLAVPLPPDEEPDPGSAQERADSTEEELAASHLGRDAARLLTMVERLLEREADLDLPTLLDLVLSELVRAVGADRGFVLLREPGEALVIRAARDAAGAPVPDPAREVSRKIAARAASEARALRAVRPAEDPRFADSRSAKALDLLAVVAAPLRYRRVDLGCVVLDRRGRSEVKVAFDDAAEDLVAHFARLASGLIVRTRRREAMQRRAESLQALFARGTEQLKQRFSADGFVGQSQAAWALLRVLERAAPGDARVLIRGESGTGKELVARIVHDSSPRAGGPFLAINCAAMPESLLEAELFGWVRGAFTGADADRAGLFERARGGTLFLDEVGDASPRLQGELLRVLQEGEVRRLGDGAVRKVDVRVIAATHRDLEAMVAEGSFREDLYYRLHVFEVRVPSLRERPEDIPLLARHFAEEARAQLDDPTKAYALDEAALQALARRPWPGNVRQLKNEVTRLVALGDLARRAAGPPEPPEAAPHDPAQPLPPGEPDEELRLEELERRAIVRALRKTGGMRAEAARLLGISRRTLYTKVRAYGLE